MSLAREQRIEGRVPGRVVIWVPKWRGALSLFPVADLSNLPLIGKSDVRAKSCTRVGRWEEEYVLCSAPGLFQHLEFQEPGVRNLALVQHPSFPQRPS